MEIADIGSLEGERAPFRRAPRADAAVDPDVYRLGPLFMRVQRDAAAG